MVSELLRLLLPATVETVAMVVLSTVFAGVLGAPIGIALVVWASDGIVPRPRTYRAVATVVDIGRSVPFVIAMVALMPLTRAVVGTSIGTAAAIVPLVVAAIPFVARIVESGLREVPRSTVEAVVGMGASPLQVVRVVYLAETKAALVRGATLVAVSLVSWSAMAGAVGGGGLGDLAVRYGYQRFRTDVMVATVVVLVVFVHLVQWLGASVARSVARP